MSKVITPTVGRKVWLRMNGRTVEGLSAHDFHTPFDATVVYVWGDRMVNLAARDHDGVPFSITSVPLLQEGDTAPQNCAYCEWVPYQKAQAEKGDAAPIGSSQAGAIVGSNLRFMAASEAASLGTGAAASPAEHPTCFSLDSDKPLDGGVCDMSSGCEACQ